MISESIGNQRFIFSEYIGKNKKPLADTLNWKTLAIPKKQVRIRWRIFSNSIGSTNGKPLAQTLSQKSLAIHQYNLESYGTHSVKLLAWC